MMALDGSPAKPKQSKIDTTNQVRGLMDDVEDYRKEVDHDFICNLIANHFSSKLFNQVDKYRHRRIRDEQTPLEALTDSEEYSDEENLEAQQRDIDAGYGGDFQAGEIFRQGGQLNTERRLKERERKRRELELQRWEFPQHISSY